MSHSVEASIAALRRCFGRAGGELAGPLAILRCQERSLSDDPPSPHVPPEALAVTLSRLRGGEAVVPRERFPVDVPRVTNLALRLAGALSIDVSGLQPSVLAGAFENAVLAVLSDLPDGIDPALTALPLERPVGLALLREALKPELLRTSLPFAPLIADLPPAPRCPLCRSQPCALTANAVACCSFCGTTWASLPGRCAACGGEPVRTLRLEKLEGAAILACGACGHAVGAFDAPDEPLGLSMHAVLAAPLLLAVKVGAKARPRGGVPVF